MANRNNNTTAPRKVVLSGKQGHGIASSRIEMEDYKVDAAARFAAKQMAERRAENLSRGW